jgi:hypothetical protein
MTKAYARTTDIEELRQRASVSTRRLYEFWEARKTGRDLPSRADFDPTEMRDWLAGLMLVDVFHDPRRLKYRLVGEVEVESRGFNPTGRWVEDGFLGDSLKDVLINYNTAIDQRRPLFDWSGYRCGGGFLHLREALFLPLADAQGVVDKVMTFSIVERA